MKRPLALAVFLGLVVLGCGDVWAATSADAAAAINRINELGGKIQRDANKNVIGVDLLGRPATDADVKLLTALGEVQSLSIWGAEISDEGVKQLAAFPKLTGLVLETTI